MSDIQRQPCDSMITLMGGYPHEDIYMDCFAEAVSTIQPVCEQVYQIPRELPYVENSTLKKLNKHIGQRKLLLSEVQFLNKSTCDYVLYAGSAPGHKTYLLSKLFPTKKFILIDPNMFNLQVDGVSHRSRPHPHIVHLMSGYPTRSNRANVPNNRLVNYIVNSPYRIFIFETCMTNELAKIFKDLPMDFISDVRSNITNARYPMDIDIAWNNSMVYNWMCIMRPVISMVKIRMLFGADPKNYKIPEYVTSEFNKSMPEINFCEDYKCNRTRMPLGELYLQCWSPQSSTESRLLVKRSDIDTIVEYDANATDNLFCYYNSVARSWSCYNNDYANEDLKFCCCADCSLEARIWYDYCTILNVDEEARASKIHELVRLADSATGRPLAKVHTINIWGLTSPDLIVSRTKEILDDYAAATTAKINQKIRVARGNAGRSQDPKAQQGRPQQ
jgi:hypothetical protein